MNKNNIPQLLMNGILIALLIFLIFKKSDNSKLEKLIEESNNKIETLKLEVKGHEKKRNESKINIDSANVVIGELPDF